MTASWRVNGGEILKYPQGFWCDESHISILSTAFSAKRRKPIGSYKPTGYSAIKGLREYVTSNDLFTAKSILKYMPVRISDKAEAMTISSCSNAMHRPRVTLRWAVLQWWRTPMLHVNISQHRVWRKGYQQYISYFHIITAIRARMLRTLNLAGTTWKWWQDLAQTWATQVMETNPICNIEAWLKLLKNLNQGIIVHATCVGHLC